MTIFCTYCSADKDPSPGNLPAIDRYQSPRIESVYKAATNLGLEFLILSGEYGILEPEAPIPYYDHLLQPSEVSEHAALVAGQLQARCVQDLVFFARSYADDVRLKPYWDCMALACQEAGVELKSVVLPSGHGDRKALRHPPTTLPSTEVRLLRSAIVGDAYRLDIALPFTYANSDRPYPVVYLADGNGLFPLLRTISEALSGGLEIPRLIIVGIGYDTDDARAWGRYRERDLLPTAASATDASRRQEFTRDGIRRGQAGSFLRFIREELKPFINANYRTIPEDSTYVGNSYGGLFGLYVLFHQPDTFARYLIGSPAIHHDDRLALAYEREYAADHDDLPARLYMAVGGREELEGHLIDPSLQFVSNVKALAEMLRRRGYPGLHLTTQVLEDETHFSVIPATFSRGLRALFPLSVWEKGKASGQDGEAAKSAGGKTDDGDQF